jgi:hypothetical protein
MVYSSAKLKINGNRVSPNYNSVQQVSGSHKYLITQALQEVVFKYIFINLTNFMAHQTQQEHSTTSRLTMSWALLKYINSQNQNI